MIIDSDGTVNPCCYWSAYGNHNETLGNVNRQTIEEIWNGPGYRRLREGMARGDLKAAGCANCFALKQGFELGLLYDQQVDLRKDPSRYAQNLRVLAEEISEGTTRLEAKPTLIALAPSHHCHLRCLHCSQEPTRHLELANVDIVDQVLALAPVLVRLNAVGGEPFILPAWRRFLREYRGDENPHLCFSTCTSASLMSEQIFEQLTRFKTININVSVDGTGSVYERVRVNAQWQKVVENIGRLRAIVDRKPGSAIGLSMSVMRSNVADLANSIRFAADLGLLFSIIPVTVPISESLASFSDIHAQTHDWADAFAAAREAVEDYWLPRHCGNKAPAESERAHWVNAVDIVAAAVPWHRLEQAHYRVTLTIPRKELAQLFGKPAARAPTGSGIFAHIQPAGEHNLVAPYHAEFEFDDAGGATITAMLPAGRFEVFVGDKWSVQSSDWFSLLVPEARHAGAPVVGTWGKGRWHWMWKAVAGGGRLSRAFRGRFAATLAANQFDIPLSARNPDDLPIR